MERTYLNSRKPWDSQGVKWFGEEEVRAYSHMTRQAGLEGMSVQTVSILQRRELDPGSYVICQGNRARKCQSRSKHPRLPAQGWPTIHCAPLARGPSSRPDSSTAALETPNTCRPAIQQVGRHDGPQFATWHFLNPVTALNTDRSLTQAWRCLETVWSQETTLLWGLGDVSVTCHSEEARALIGMVPA